MATTVLCIYRVKGGEEARFRELLARHWPRLRDLGLATDEPAQVYFAAEGPGSPFFVEIFHWVDETAPDKAHQLPEVLSIWEPMGALCEERDGRSAMEFPHVEPIALHTG